MLSPFIIVLEAKVLFGSLLVQPFLVHVSIPEVIVSERILERRIDRMW